MDLTDELIAVAEAKLERLAPPTKSGSTMSPYLSWRAMNGQGPRGPVRAFPKSPHSKTFPAEFKVR